MRTPDLQIDYNPAEDQWVSCIKNIGQDKLLVIYEPDRIETDGYHVEILKPGDGFYERYMPVVAVCQKFTGWPDDKYDVLTGYDMAVNLARELER